MWHYFYFRKTLVNKDFEIENLKKNLEIKVAQTNRDDYSLNPVEENNLSFLKINFKTSKDELMPSECISQQQRCEDCDTLFSSRENLRTHICQIELKNPVFRKLEINKVIFPKQCSPVFSHKNRKEIAFLHSDDCWNLSSYCNKLPSWFFGEPLRDNDGNLHLKMKDFVTNRELNWEAFNYQISEAINLRKICSNMEQIYNWNLFESENDRMPVKLIKGYTDKH